MPKLNATSEIGLGVVVIGRNEGNRLQVCLLAVLRELALLNQTDVRLPIVYVDSGSTDGSVEFAKSLGISVYDLDLSVPFTAARARQAGLAQLQALFPELTVVQFLDGDCEVHPGWLGRGVQFIHAHDKVAVVSGRLRERYPLQSVYNTLCDLEWNAPVGLAKACGGNAMMRIDVVNSVGGYREDLIAGEEPELCVRLRQAGWQVWRIEGEMALHDAAMFKFGQWWKRTVRAGYAFAQGASIHGSAPERHWVKETRSAWLWAGVLPLLILTLSIFASTAAWSLFLIYPMQIARLCFKDYFKGGLSLYTAWNRAFYTVLGKFAELAGQLKFLRHQCSHSNAAIIEYK